jgi:hypothetical protein
MSHRPVCVKCQVELRPEKNEVGCLDFASFGPYQLWDSDLWKCPKCGHEILTGFGQNPISIHHEENFTITVERWKEYRKVVENYES